jgi:hypothetical protein
MMSCTTLAAWNRPVLSLCCTEHGSSRSAILSGHITTVAMSRSDQVGQRCTIELHCSGLHILQTLGEHTSVPWKHASLATCLG